MVVFTDMKTRRAYTSASCSIFLGETMIFAAMEKEKRTICYATNRKDEIARIQAEYSLPEGYNINREVECMLSKDDIKNLQEEVKKGLIEIRRK